MNRKQRLERKPLSFSTTMRNPERIALFVESFKDYEGEILTNDLIKSIIKKWIVQKLIRSDSVLKTSNELMLIYNDDYESFTDEQAEYIYSTAEKLTKGHKEAGFDKGWPSRFDTYMKLPMELGFVYYQLQCPVEISETGKLLIQANQKEDGAGEALKNTNIRIEDLFLNALVKYQTNNPFRRNLISNAPFVLFIQAIGCLSSMEKWDKSGVYRHEIPAITRHLKEFAKGKEKLVFSLFIAPYIHIDTQYMIDFSKARDDVDIYPFSIADFVKAWANSKDIKDLVANND